MPGKANSYPFLNILQNLRDLDGLKQLFWQELNYERENRPLSPRQWPESTRQLLAEDPILFATGGEDKAFHVVYCRLESDALKRGHERPIVNRLMREHPYALFVFSNRGRTDWRFLNVKYDEEVDKRRLLRRITVRPGEGLRTAAERIQMLDLETISPDLLVLSPLTIQQRHDDAFDVEKVTKDFYREIANWYFWALRHVKFPKDAPKEEDGRDHISVIRLITRLIFCWFIREKGLIPDVLFDEAKLAEMLEGFAPGKKQNKDSVFYRAILQNLFFATLNTEMDQRGWRRTDQNFMAHSLYRHKECFRDPKTALEWFKDIPFLNGGLFECLDRDLGEGAKPRYLRVDGFSDRDDSRPTVPDFLFFGSEQDVDLSDDYGDKKFRSVRVRGLIDTLNRYKFTIQENTPLDQEVALDPELCGKVFENLLAAYNPETGTTARKATGSFYTPREIVDYMVDESLVAYLKGKLTGKAAKESDKALRALLAYDGEPHVFDEKATEELIDAIDTLKALDPAVGSGAFPMGILHKLVLVLGKLDPDNERWKAKQIAKLDDATMREDAERLFRENYDDYGRKLYLIENCIYGVDIQPIAVQIAKMRFFISLIVDQKVNLKAPNLGVRALPNLETKFVAANTLIGIDRPAQMMLRNPAIDKKEEELCKVREKHFTAKTLKSKAKCREYDKKLRAEIAELLRNDGWHNTTARQLAAWDPYDQNTHADFFEPEWMFGVTSGLSIVIGNPPYIRIQELDAPYAAYLKTHYAAATGKFDAYVCFIEKGMRLLEPDGVLCFISPNKFLRATYGEGIRGLIAKGKHLSMILDFGEAQQFESVTSYTCILLLAAKAQDKVRAGRAKPSADLLGECSWVSAPHPTDSEPWVFEDAAATSLIEKARTYPHLGDRCTEIFQGIISGGDKFFYLEVLERNSKTVVCKSPFRNGCEELDAATCFNLLKGAEIKRYAPLAARFIVVFPYELASNGSTRLLPEDRLRREHPKTYAYLSKYRRELSERGSERMEYEAWYALWCPRSLSKLTSRKILTQVLASRASYTLDNEGVMFFTGGGNAGAYGLIPCEGIDPLFALGILNSRYHDFLLKKTSSIFRGGYFSYARRFIERLPFPYASQREQERIASVVSEILTIKRKTSTQDTSSLEKRVDQLVYRLFSLSASEVELVEREQDVEAATQDDES